jgi:hypothetical protein
MSSITTRTPSPAPILGIVYFMEVSLLWIQVFIIWNERFVPSCIGLEVSCTVISTTLSDYMMYFMTGFLCSRKKVCFFPWFIDKSTTRNLQKTFQLKKMFHESRQGDADEISTRYFFRDYWCRLLVWSDSICM